MKEESEKKTRAILKSFITEVNPVRRKIHPSFTVLFLSFTFYLALSVQLWPDLDDRAYR